ncbi:hypothetical protein [Pedobacter caeni]|uniref:Uncharacterized protein n=1 Tax=Pedobacter caeni TaxID=288992 RepID=A0A1M5IX61_9SPHI|nr:hypothetical protein [Pedobacter caeni]SHG32922.1 hypothetical protein SAMN04488522_105103 [Pedobacter caeni]
MKKTLTLALLSILALTSCSNEDKAKATVKTYLSKTMHDFKSYEPVEFGKLDSALSIFELTPYYTERYQAVMKILARNKALDEEYERLAISRNSYDPELVKNVAIRGSLVDSGKKIVADLEIKKKGFKQTFAGYALPHTYRGKNAHGAVVINTDTFYLDKDLKSVERVNNIKWKN